MSRKLPKATDLTLNDLKEPAAEAPPESPPEEPEAPQVPLDDETATALRRSRAREIVERYSAYAAVGGILPLPLVDTVSVFLAQVEMVRALSHLYEVPFRRDRTRAAVAAVATTAGQAAAGALVATALARATPGANVVALAASSAAALALARTIGMTFIEHFEDGGTGEVFDLDHLRRKAKSLRAAARAGKPAAA